MDSVKKIANYVYHKYNEIAHEILDEMKLHKLLYFTQRETLAILGKPAFSDNFQGWKYGPVIVSIRNYYKSNEIQENNHDISEELAYIINNVIQEYGILASWKLSDLSYEEISWRNSRIGLKPDENGSKIILLDDIKKDAQKVRPYDHIWDMYYDEFEDLETENSDV